MRNNSEVARSSRGRTIKPTQAAIAVATSRRGKSNGARGSGRGGVATAPRGGRGAVTGSRGSVLPPRGGRGAVLPPREGRGAAIGQRGRGAATSSRGGGRGANEYDIVDDNDVDDEEEQSGGEGTEEAAEAELDVDEEEDSDGEQGTLYLRGPATLPPLPATDHEKNVLKPAGDYQWEELGGGKKRRNPTGVLTLLLKECFPGFVNYNGRIEPPYTWEHYAAAPDAPDEHGIEYNNCLERVEERFWQYFRWATNEEDTEAQKAMREQEARRVLHKAIENKMKQFYYEERKTVVVFYYARFKKQKVTRTEACLIKLTEAQYMQAIPSWAAPHSDCWLQIVQERWCNDDWLKISNSCRGRRSLMSGPAHRQGSRSFVRFKRDMEEKQKRPVSDMDAYMVSRKGSENGVLCNGRTQEILEKYSEAAKEKYGTDFDVTKEPFDPEVVYKVGSGKKTWTSCPW